jgi:cytochrome c
MSRFLLAVSTLASLAVSSAVAADARRGEARFKALCGTCHAVEPGVRKMSSGWTWTPQLLDRYLADPKKALPGTTMMVAAGNADRADIVAYIVSLK